jgi:lipoic acid synthetase
LVSFSENVRSSTVIPSGIGQYLQPTTTGHLPVLRYVHPDVFKQFETEAYAMGFRHAAVGALVRSSYHADQQAHQAAAV